MDSLREISAFGDSGGAGQAPSVLDRGVGPQASDHSDACRRLNLPSARHLEGHAVAGGKPSVVQQVSVGSGELAAAKPRHRVLQRGPVGA